jgi:sucrose phosphorylase
MKNQVQLIVYADRLSGGTLRDLHALLTGPLRGVFGGVHVLPFFHPIDGADAGFDPIDHTQVDPRLGDWKDIQALTRDIDVMADVIVNHMSVDSPQFRDWSATGAQSIYDGLFLTLDAVFPHGATERDLVAVYRPRPGLPFSSVTLASGEQRVLWTTFTPQQIDIDVRHLQGRAYLDGILRRFGAHGIRMVRLDAVGYAIKRAGGSCFMMPETFAFIEELSAAAKSQGIEVLVEIHSHYRSQIEIAAQVDWVYDFALPPLVLHAIYFKTSRCLAQWIRIRPTNAVTVLDTHDGIGIIDAGADATDRAGRPGLVPQDELERLVEMIHAKSLGHSRRATGAAASNLDLYQVNCTFYDALGRDDRAYLLARAIQFFVPGVPQVYYVGLLAGHNDMELLARTGVGRDINRHYFKPGEAAQALAQPVVRQLLALIAFRNSQRAFDGTFELLPAGDQRIDMRWQLDAQTARLTIDLSDLSFELTGTGASGPFLVTLDPA